MVDANFPVVRDETVKPKLSYEEECIYFADRELASFEYTKS